MVEGLCRGLLRDRDDCEDASQQTFLSAYRALLGGSSPRDPAAWLATIARNECLGRIGERMRRPLPVSELRYETSTLPDPLAEAIRRADLAALWAHVSALPRQQRDALVMREFAGLRYDELAVALGVSGPAVESLLFRARTRLRAVLQPAFSLGSLPLSLRDAVARLAGAGAAAKVGTATVGVAVIAGGAVAVTPSVERHRHPALTHPGTPAAVRPAHRAAQAVSASRPRPAPFVPVVAVARSSDPDERGDDGPSGREDRGSNQNKPGEQDESGTSSPPEEAAD